MPKAAVLGSPIAHSKSPLLHLAAYKLLGLDWTYERFDVSAGQLPAFLEQVDDDFCGFSVTMPLKREAFELASVSDPAALEAQAVNTLVRSPDGWRGFNTDVTGTLALLAHQPIESVVVLGAGATARSLLVALRKLGMQSCHIMARQLDRAQSLANALQLSATFSTLSEGIPDCDLLVSTLPGSANLRFDLPAGCRGILDVSYEPWPTALMAAAESSGVSAFSGLDLLVYQAAEQVVLMTGCSSALVEQIRAAMYTELTLTDPRHK